MKILVTGAAGFIGFHLCQHLLKRGDTVIGIDNLNDYYAVSLKEDRIAQLKPLEKFTFYKLDLCDKVGIKKLFSEHQFEAVAHLAAQAGVRYSLKNPYAYIDSNLVGFINVLEGCRHHQIPHLVFASSSSVYGSNKTVPFSVGDYVDYPVSLYAATKKANELMAHSYSHLYHIPTTGLRFFTVYGPWYRPDMAMFIFTKAILADQPIPVFNYGNMERDFTYVDDVVEGVIRVIDKIPQPGSNQAEIEGVKTTAPYQIYNIGNNKPVNLLYLIEVLENVLGKKAQKNMLPMQPGDVPITYANVDSLIADVGFKPSTPIEVGVEKFVAWYKSYYGV
ncbi:MULTISPECIES: NAD-dependent epimerase [Arthrospira]|uniref:Nucleotide sugar epimerase n=1 Tax=Limnospira platensis NIES-46 TaxID=1236695 RepID=A0A5M3T7W0_LIMPL|nr:NAD-dependent epimerase [Arthrospira platensis]KDR55236.1 capsular biosynthesis protein CpsI [Arthrospira platensis str. Paraca]MBD2573543.1 NAD-dependent epimerase [Arthrospira platensis FACHB-971]MBD2667678.1 NAD-dependent epimerase [Arthrospira platensis FACHB-439]MBD2708996.1 NAD-dependent epimerase [Arthrospira platensis FACHB-835]MDF2208179.1 NAD-dependent epimerase [Arthrospira platensis NCB002]MDT9295519.1 NAD-dependent epimerase [Arthrospira platensis PCC 7345]MDT9311320.1 NAD-de